MNTILFPSGGRNNALNHERMVLAAVRRNGHVFKCAPACIRDNVALRKKLGVDKHVWAAD